MASEPPESGDPSEEYDRKQAEEAKKRADAQKPPPDPAGNGSDPPLTGPDNVVPISQGRRRNTKPKPEPPDVKGIVEATSELALQRKFSEIHGESLKFVATDGGEWHYWAGQHWRPDDTGHIRQLIKEFLWAEARSSLWVEEGKRLAHSKTVRDIEYLAQSDPRHAATRDLWDRSPLVAGSPTMAIDLQTGAMRPHWREDYLLLSTAVDPAPLGTPCPLWMKFLNEATGDDAAYIGFLQRCCGYWLTGSIKEHVLIFLHGEGGNGKGVFIRTIANILHQYHASLKKEMFAAVTKGQRDASTDYWYASLQHKRLVTVEEIEEGSEWSAGTIKVLTGGDQLPARNPFGRPFYFWPTHKIAITGNSRPYLPDRSQALERRMRNCPWDKVPSVVDHDLEEKLRAEWPAILAWMIQGAVLWCQQGLGTCDIVRESTETYFEEADTFGDWFAECCILEAGYRKHTPTELLNHFNAFAKKAHAKTVGKNRFAEKLKTKGLKADKIAHGGKRRVEGIRLKTPAERKKDEQADLFQNGQPPSTEPSIPPGGTFDDDDGQWNT